MANVHLGERFENFIAEVIREGRYQNASEVVRAGLRLLEDREAERKENYERLKAEIKAAIEDPRPPIPMDEVFDRLEARLSKRMKDNGETTQS
ncbi:MAG: type II toxin-antitoxin system ParD family antitoxin [Beijerinckiaceae bacterium]|jgi:antitoxin ParD1/3/4|nr:type II toxin-antitoxin system ParD family antitoxin [Beijerinckiaceae bacterium]